MLLRRTFKLFFWIHNLIFLLLLMIFKNLKYFVFLYIYFCIYFFSWFWSAVLYFIVNIILDLFYICVTLNSSKKSFQWSTSGTGYTCLRQQLTEITRKTCLSFQKKRQDWEGDEKTKALAMVFALHANAKK